MSERFSAELKDAYDTYERFPNKDTMERIIRVLRKELSTYPIDKVTRFKVIDHTYPTQGRVVVKYDVEVEVSFQDQGRTLKVFLTDRTKEDK